MLAAEFRYPHLLEIDALIWHGHKLKHGDKYHQIDYDVRVGDGRDPGPDFDDNIRKMSLDLSCRRIDAVCHSASGIDVIEVTHSAGFTALGQLIAYPILYAKKVGRLRPIRPVLVAGEIQTDIQPVLDRLQIEYHIYPLSERPSNGRT